MLKKLAKELWNTVSTNLGLNWVLVLVFWYSLLSQTRDHGSHHVDSNSLILMTIRRIGNEMDTCISRIEECRTTGTHANNFSVNIIRKDLITSSAISVYHNMWISNFISK